MPRNFSTWCAKAIAGIGKLRDTIMDRSIVLNLRRKRKDEKTELLRYGDTEQFLTLRRKLVRFAADCAETVGKARPDMSNLFNRNLDNWEPLFAIADIAGGEWPALIRETALKLTDEEADESTQSIGVELLADIKEIFEMKRVEKIIIKDLIYALCEDQEKPWATYNRGISITPRQVGRMLSGYKIKSKPIRIVGTVYKCYCIEQFTDAFERYLNSGNSENDMT
jgi:putative DNA primase/helicase